MTYYSGFLVAVPTANKQAYADHAKKSWPMFQKRGALRMIEAWGEGFMDQEIAVEMGYQSAAVVKTSRLRCLEKLRALYRK